MKKLVSAVAASSFLLLAACSSDDATNDSKEKKEKLVVSTWGFNEDFFRNEIYKPFEEENNVEIVLDTGNNADRLNKVRQGNSDVDVIFL
ncbi:MAG: ABC transporter substrate-binding protein, partial [Niallia sp.]